MHFRTPVSAIPSEHKISLQTPILAIGSCFADTMGEKLLANKFPVLVNPFGVLFNPVSIARLLEMAIGGAPAQRSGLVNTPEGWRHYDFHSRIAATDPDEVLLLADRQVALANNFLETAEWLLITLGTAFGYRRTDTGQVVANCHKVPNSQFSKELLPLEIILSSLRNVFQQLTSQYTRLNIVLTVSPVRHIKDTLPLNSVSKSLLRVACHQLTQEFDQVQYFPALEIMTDDLRDYRFYKADMIHPSEVAETYIWQKFTEAFMDTQTLHFLEEWTKIRQALSHRPFNVHAPAHQAFLRNTIARLQKLKTLIAVEEEIASLTAQLVPPDPSE